tara:strand:+ start:1042 stop:1260 length:219 start_codon:yes stop_codon:yes gene_type:complete
MDSLVGHTHEVFAAANIFSKSTNGGTKKLLARPWAGIVVPIGLKILCPIGASPESGPGGVKTTERNAIKTAD